MTTTTPSPQTLGDTGSDVPDTMRAVVVHGPEDYRLETVPVPVPAEGELLLRVDAVGVCASDLKCYHGAAKFWGDENRPAWAERDRIAGHEFVGTVVAGDDAALAKRGVALGDRIACEQIVPCWECRYCLMGAYWMCGPHDMFGFKGFDGAMAEYVRVPTRALTHPVSRDLAPQVAAFCEPLSCAMHAVERGGITFDDVVVIAGAGPIGLGAIAGTRQKNPKLVIALDMSDDKLALATKAGADIVINITKQDAVAVVKELTGGYGADVYIEATGHPSAVSQGLNLLRKLGTYVEYSVFGSNASVDWSIISDDKELNVLGAHLGPNCWPAAIKLLESGVLPMDEICTHQFPLEQFQEALDLVADSAGGSVKVSIVPSLTEAVVAADARS
ncbi:erythritol/L-threitol dehydrogenase [Rathayibacter sp. AY2B7]|uniref:zinc-binding dehydrogenase n=1 Tax=unclassified Rathayibacter TaxID=2609250 RepID=UPI000CE758F2|nr:MULTISPECIES: zinc-binding dehydrogenase [unclassified Rathayibacter]PPG10164.1 erythritol/L-threitol dehydrogenase [Rathayibacter sp. AY2B1]PPG62077.1 erythritol/L-threitol dehydrogenase [Rathayibacter sp. AY2B7]PPG73794.1 erythritol/L-threitol dehydrogenase [Rathayibacter sp. AY1F4]